MKNGRQFVELDIYVDIGSYHFSALTLPEGGIYIVISASGLLTSIHCM